MCGEDGTQGGVYKLREEHAEEGIGTKKEKERKAQTKEEEQKERKSPASSTKENDLCSNFRPSRYVRVNLFNIPQLI